jgi:DNA sulfur modification protein DndC
LRRAATANAARAARTADRLRKAGAEHLKDGSIAKNPQRMGPLTLEARQMGLERVLGIQAEINATARALGRPRST